MAKKIVKDDTDYVLKEVVAAMQEKKAKNIVSLRLNKIPNAVAEYFVITHASSKTQVGAIYDSIVENVKNKCGINPYHKEGYENSEWILIDYSDVVVHIFQESIRSFYQLEELWADAKLKEYKSDV